MSEFRPPAGARGAGQSASRGAAAAGCGGTAAACGGAVVAQRESAMAAPRGCCAASAGDEASGDAAARQTCRHARPRDADAHRRAGRAGEPKRRHGARTRRGRGARPQARAAKTSAACLPDLAPPASISASARRCPRPS